MAKKSIGFVFIMLFAIVCHGQKFELGKVSVAELQEKSHPTDSAAVAAICSKKQKLFLPIHKKQALLQITWSYAELKFIKKRGCSKLYLSLWLNQ